MKIVKSIIWVCITMSASISMANEVRVEVTHIDVKRGGNISVMFFAEEGFPKEHKKALQTQTKKVEGSTMIFMFETNMKEMAVKIHHDEDSNGKVTKNWTGIWPKEGLGFANGQKVSLKGAPTYEKSKLSYKQFKGGLTIPILYP